MNTKEDIQATLKEYRKKLSTGGSIILSDIDSLRKMVDGLGEAEPVVKKVPKKVMPEKAAEETETSGIKEEDKTEEKTPPKKMSYRKSRKK